MIPLAILQGASVTAAIFIDGRKIEGPITFAELNAFFAAETEKAARTITINVQPLISKTRAVFEKIRISDRYTYGADFASDWADALVFTRRLGYYTVRESRDRRGRLRCKIERPCIPHSRQIAGSNRDVRPGFSLAPRRYRFRSRATDG